MNAVIDRWNIATTFVDLLSLNQDYIQSRPILTPYTTKPYVEDTPNITQRLLNLNRHSVFTYYSKLGKTINRTNGLGQYQELQQRDVLSAIIFDPGLLDSLLKRLTVFASEIEVWVDQVNPSQIIISNSPRCVIRVRYAGDKSWTEKMAICNNSSSELVLSHLDGMLGKRFWSIDVVSRSWGLACGIVDIVDKAACASWRLGLENLPVELVEMISSSCEIEDIANLRLTSQTLSRKTNMIFQRHCRRFTCHANETHQMSKTLDLFLDVRTQVLCTNTETLHLVLPLIDKNHPNTDELFDRASRFHEKLISAACIASNKLRNIELDLGCPELGDTTPRRCMASILHVVSQQSARALKVHMVRGTLRGLTEACRIASTSNQQHDPIAFLRNDMKDYSRAMVLCARENLDRQLETLRPPIETLSISLGCDSEVRELELVAPRLILLRRVTIHMFNAHVTASRAAVLCKNLLATTVQDVIISGYSFCELSFTEAWTNETISILPSQITLRAFRGNTICEISHVQPPLYINRYIRDGYVGYRTEDRRHPTDSQLEDCYLVHDNETLIEVSACSLSWMVEGWIGVSTEYQGELRNGWISQHDFERIARPEDSELLRNLWSKRNDIMCGRFRGFLKGRYMGS